MGPKSSTECPGKNRKGEDTDTRRKPGEEETGERYLQAKENARDPDSHQKLGMKHRIDSLSEPPEGNQPCLHFDFGILASRTVRERNFCCFKP